MRVSSPLKTDQSLRSPEDHLIGSQRCLTPVTGFIEYHWFSDKNKQPYFVHLASRKDFMIAGLYEVTPIPIQESFILLIVKLL